MFSILALLDDVAATLDDVSVMTKIALKKTSALMSDDLAVNAGVVVGANPDRELPIVRSIFWGSLINKVYCIVGVLLLEAFFPFALTIILLLGGLYLSYEGAHKVFTKIFTNVFQGKNGKSAKEKELSEDQKISGAIKTDLILSIEIIVLAKAAMSGDLWQQGLSLMVVGLAASIIIYGLVALLVKIDDFGLYLIRKNYKRIGLLLVEAMPYVMKGLGIVGTLAMFLVGGGIIAHTFHLPLFVFELGQNLVLGFVAGMLTLGLLKLASPLKTIFHRVLWRGQ